MVTHVGTKGGSVLPALQPALPDATAMIQAEAELVGRGNTAFDHGLVVWCGFSGRAVGTQSPHAREMEALYKTPFEKFSKYCFEGSPADVAEQLAPYAETGCRRFSIIPVGDNIDHEIDCVPETARDLRRVLVPLAAR